MNLPITCGRCGAGLGRILNVIVSGRAVGNVNEFYDIDSNLLHRCDVVKTVDFGSSATSTAADNGVALDAAIDELKRRGGHGIIKVGPGVFARPQSLPETIKLHGVKPL